MSMFNSLNSLSSSPLYNSHSYPSSPVSMNFTEEPIPSIGRLDVDHGDPTHNFDPTLQTEITMPLTSSRVNSVAPSRLGIPGIPNPSASSVASHATPVLATIVPPGFLVDPRNMLTGIAMPSVPAETDIAPRAVPIQNPVPSSSSHSHGPISIQVNVDFKRRSRADALPAAAVKAPVKMRKESADAGTKASKPAAPPAATVKAPDDMETETAKTAAGASKVPATPAAAAKRPEDMDAVSSEVDAAPLKEKGKGKRRYSKMSGSEKGSESEKSSSSKASHKADSTQGTTTKRRKNEKTEKEEKSEAERKARRRKQNRDAAKASRERRKEALEKLNKRVAQLESLNLKQKERISQQEVRIAFLEATLTANKISFPAAV